MYHPEVEIVCLGYMTRFSDFKYDMYVNVIKGVSG